MQINEHLDRAMASARGLKEQRIAEATGATQIDTDLHGIIEGFRGDAPVVVLMPAKIDRDESLKAAFIAATAFGCDLIAMTTESWHPAKTDEEDYALYNPVTGERATFEEVKSGKKHVWPPGSMQEVALEHGGLEKGWIVEDLMTVVVTRAGDLASGMQDYKVTRTTNALGITKSSIEWLGEPQILDTLGDAKVAGVIPANMVAFMNEPPLDVHMAQMGISGADFGLTPVQAQAHTDCATVKYLLRMVDYEGAVLLTADSPERREVIERSLGDHPGLIR